MFALVFDIQNNPFSDDFCKREVKHFEKNEIFITGIYWMPDAVLGILHKWSHLPLVW